MELTSPAFGNHDTIPVEYSIDGVGVSPPLRISDVPQEAQSLALVLDDPDVPRMRQPSGTFDHWVVWNLPADLTELASGNVPPGKVGLNSLGRNEYVPPAPPAGEHRYYFYLYALDTDLDLPDGTTKAELFDAMRGHVLAVCSLMGRYARSVDR